MYYIHLKYPDAVHVPERVGFFFFITFHLGALDIWEKLQPELHQKLARSNVEKFHVHIEWEGVYT